MDCGGLAPNGCQINKKCKVDKDCYGGNCGSNKKCGKPTPKVTCSDKNKNHLETCVDGGGAECVRLGKLCPNGAACKKSADCTGSVCAVKKGAKLGKCISCKGTCGRFCDRCSLGGTCEVTEDCGSGLVCLKSKCSLIGKVVVRTKSTASVKPDVSIVNGLWVDVTTAAKTGPNTEVACTGVTVRVVASNGTTLDMPKLGSTDKACFGKVKTDTKSLHELYLSGPPVCVNKVLRGFKIEPSCATPWYYTGSVDTGVDDRAAASVSATVTAVADKIYRVTSQTSSLAVTLLGRSPKSAGSVSRRTALHTAR